MEAPWRIELLGWLRATQGDRVVTRFRSHKTGALLAYLTFYRHRSHPREALIDLHWPECDPAAGRLRLRIALTSLRHQLEPPGVPAGAVIMADRATVQLNPAACTTDVGQFDDALRAVARARAAGERATLLIQAVEGYGGELLSGYHEDWILLERARLAEAHLQALSSLVAALEEIGDPIAALRWARRAASTDPLWEQGRRDLIRLLVATGEPDASLHQYHELERRLAEELGALPAAETVALTRRLHLDVRSNGGRRQGAIAVRPPPTADRPPPTDDQRAMSNDPAPSAARFPLLPPPPASSLPLQFTRFFGREEEIRRLGDILTGQTSAASRLVTLTGPAGSGKTRMGIEVAGELKRAGPVWFVPLAELASPDLILEKVCEVLRAPHVAGVDPLARVAPILSRGPCLLVLDNFEHLVEEGALVVRHLLEHAPPLRCLVTSRQTLGLEGEREFPVLPLPVPEEDAHGSWHSAPGSPDAIVQCPSVQLFVDRAQTVHPEFQVTSRNVAEVATLCRRLEGLPLALELAAARASVLAPAQMLVHLEHRLEFLVSRRRDASPRHRSLRVAIEGSYHLLSPTLQQFFAGLSVFRNGWTLDAAAAVCGDRGAQKSEHESDVLESLRQLKECSLILSAEPPDSAIQQMRFRMLEALREYGREQLSPEEHADAQRRHAQFYLTLAAQAAQEFQGSKQWASLDALEPEHENLRAAVDWAVEVGDAGLGLRLVAALWEFWWVRGHMQEARRRLHTALEMSSGAPPTPARARVLYGAGQLAYLNGDRVTAEAVLREAAAAGRACGEPLVVADAFCILGEIAHRRGDTAMARPLVQEALNIGMEAGDLAMAASAYHVLAEIEVDAGSVEKGVALYEESLVLFRRADAKRGIAWTYDFLGGLAARQNDLVTARAYFAAALAIRRELGHQWGTIGSLCDVGQMALEQKEFGEARDHFREGLLLSWEGHDLWGIARILCCLAQLAKAQGRPQRALRLLAASMAAQQFHGGGIDPDQRRQQQETLLAELGTAFDAGAFRASWQAARDTAWEQVVVEVLGEDDDAVAGGV